MTAGRFWTRCALGAIVVLLMLDNLTGFISWLDDQKGGTQLLIGIVLTVGLTLLGRIVEWIAAAIWKGFKRVWTRWLSTAKPIETPRTRIGLYEHIINRERAYARLSPAIESVGNRNAAIMSKLTKHADALPSDADVYKRQKAMDRLTTDLKPDLVELEKVAGQVADDTRVVVESYRSVFTKTNINTFADRMALLAERDTLRQAAKNLRVAMVGINKSRDSMAPLIHLAPDAGQRYEQAITKLINGFDELTEFCANESQAIANQRAGRGARLWAVVRPSSARSTTHTEAPLS